MTFDESMKCLVTRKLSGAFQAILGTATYSGGASTEVNVTGHNYQAGYIVYIDGTGDHDGAWTIDEVTDNDHFVILDPFTSSKTGIVIRDTALIDDITADVLAWKMPLSVSETVGTLTMEIVQQVGGYDYRGRYKPKDAIELWVWDGTTSITYPSTIRDTSRDTSRAFLGRIESVSSRWEQGLQIFQIVAKEYSADLIEAEAERCYVDSAVHDIWDALLALFNTTRGTGVDLLNGQPSFLADFPAAAETLEYWYANDIPFWDAFGEFVAKKDLRMKVDSTTYSPRAVASPTNHPTLSIYTRPAASGLPWSIVQGTNLVGIELKKTIATSRNDVQINGVLEDGTPMRVEVSTGTTTGDDIGTDRHGKIMGFTNNTAVRSYAELDNLADSVLANLDTAKKEYVVEVYPARLTPATPLIGDMVSVTCSDLGLSATEFEVYAVTYKWSSVGLEMEVEIGEFSESIGRLFGPIAKKTRDEFYKVLYADYFLYHLEYEDADNIALYKYNPFTAAGGTYLGEKITTFGHTGIGTNIEDNVVLMIYQYGFLYILTATAAGAVDPFDDYQMIRYNLDTGAKTTWSAGDVLDQKRAGAMAQIPGGTIGTFIVSLIPDLVILGTTDVLKSASFNGAFSSGEFIYETRKDATTQDILHSIYGTGLTSQDGTMFVLSCFATEAETAAPPISDLNFYLRSFTLTALVQKGASEGYDATEIKLIQPETFGGVDAVISDIAADFNGGIWFWLYDDSEGTYSLRRLNIKTNEVSAFNYITAGGSRMPRGITVVPRYIERQA